MVPVTDAGNDRTLSEREEKDLYDAELDVAERTRGNIALGDAHSSGAHATGAARDGTAATSTPNERGGRDYTINLGGNIRPNQPDPVRTAHGVPLGAETFPGTRIPAGGLIGAALDGVDAVRAHVERLIQPVGPVTGESGNRLAPTPPSFTGSVNSAGSTPKPSRAS